jgi:pSer/pThr/pTyr-binding forkhead associated (FHA) protein
MTSRSWIAARFVSRWHCAILVLPDGTCTIRDLGSTHGVYVDGERTKDLLRLKDGGEIHVGGRRLVLLASVNGTANHCPACTVRFGRHCARLCPEPDI